MNELSLTPIALIVIGVPLFLFLGTKASSQLNIMFKIARIEVRQQVRHRKIRKRFSKARSMPAMEQLFESQTPRGIKLKNDSANHEQMVEQEMAEIQVLSEELKRLREDSKTKFTLEKHVSAIFFIMAAALYAFSLWVSGINIWFSLLSAPFAFFGLISLSAIGFVCLVDVRWWFYVVVPVVLFIGLGLWF